MTDESNNSRRFVLPPGYSVRYDYHEHPRGISAILFGPIGSVRSVGFAKFNPRDGAFDLQLGRSIALGRALAKLPRHLTRPKPQPDAIERAWDRMTRERQRLQQTAVLHDGLFLSTE